MSQHKDTSFLVESEPGEGPSPRDDVAALNRDLLNLASVFGQIFHNHGSRVNINSSNDEVLPRAAAAGLVVNAQEDTYYAHSDNRFTNIVHVFNQNWHGIRSAAGALPGHKVAYPDAASIKESDVLKFKSFVETSKIKRAVVHGFSPAANQLVHAMRQTGLEIYLVWHGNLAQLIWEPEVYYFELALSACKKGLFRRAHMLKSGVGDIFPNTFSPMLLNSPPLLRSNRTILPFASKSAIALISAYSDIRKNGYSSLLGAARSPSITDVLYYGKLRRIFPEMSRCRPISYRGHDAHLSLMRNVDVSVNVTAIDCHPMVDLEALAGGAFAVTGPLFLDAFGDHPYTKLSVISNPFDVTSISERLCYLRGIAPLELSEIIRTYRAELCALSINRYVEFLEL